MNKYCITILTAILVTFSLNVYSQTRVIKGQLVEKNGSPIDYATVILQKSDSTFVGGTQVDSLGRFSFKTELLSYRVICQHLMYNTKEIASSKANLGIIQMTLKDNMLVAVTVKGERPLVVVKDGILSYNIKQITKGKVVSNAYDAILKLPGVSEKDGQISMVGTNGVSVIINGRPSTMSSSQLITLLKQMSASRINTAEVMYSTPPQFHVKGAAINLIINNFNDTKSPILQGKVKTSYLQYTYADYSSGVSLLYSFKKISLDFLYAFTDWSSKSGLDLLSHHNLSGKTHKINQHNRGKSQGETHTGRLGFDYKIDKNNILSLVYNTSIQAHGKSKEYSLGTYSNSQSNTEDNSKFHNISLDYSSGFGLKTGINYTYYSAPSVKHYSDVLKENNFESEYVSSSKQKINSFTFYADQEYKLKNNWKLTYGTKLAYADDHDYQVYKISEGGDDLYNTDNTIKENIYDFYIGGSKHFSDKLSMNFSLTEEYYKLAKDGEWSIFPQLQLTYAYSSKHIIQFSFSSNKKYPTYWEKQDYKSQLNAYTEVYGNPALKACNTYSAKLAYIRNQKYIFILYHTYQPDYSAQLAYQSTEKLSLIYETQNWDYNQKLGFTIILPFEICSWFDTELTFDGFYHHAKYKDFYDIGFDNEKFCAFGAIDNTINISTKPNIKLNISAYCITDPIQGIYDLSSVWNVDAKISWVFANNRAALSIEGEDIFNSSLPKVSVRSQTQSYNMNTFSDGRSLGIYFSYKFGGYKAKERKEVSKARYGH